MFDIIIEAYRKGDRRKRHSILMKWSLFGFLASLTGFCLEIVLGWSVGRALAMAGILGVIVLIIIGLNNLTSDNKKSLAYLNEPSSTRGDILFKWTFISFGVALFGFFIGLFFSWPIGSDVLLLGILLTICLVVAAIQNFQSGPD